VMPEPLVTAFLAGAIFCGICSYQRRPHRRVWHTAFWICTALACLTKGLLGIVYPAAIFLLLSIFYREARMRFRALLRWEYLLIFFLIVAPWHIWAQWHFPGYFRYLVNAEWLGHLRGLNDATHDFKGVPASEFLLMHLAWWFPWSIAVLPGAIFTWRRVIRPREIEFSDALLLCWMGIIFVPLLFLGQRQDYYSMSMWSALALWAALAWDRMPSRWRAVGAVAVGLVGVISLALAFLAFNATHTFNGQWGAMDERWTAWKALHDTPASTWLALRPMFTVAGCSLVSLSLISFYLILKQREKLAAIVLAIAMLPTGLAMIEGVGRMAPYFSLAELGRFLNAQLDENDETLFEGPVEDSSSLIFYLNRKFFIVNQNRKKEAPLGEPSLDIFLNENAVLEKWDGSNAVYLIVEQERVGYWKQLLTERFHIYHQVTASGTYVVLSNQL
jgi:4-amino-4-deoxy-L-arabinose transferase-like glycosyltransferase